jgi:hypothetical protein
MNVFFLYVVSAASLMRKGRPFGLGWRKMKKSTWKYQADIT